MQQQTQLKLKLSYKQTNARRKTWLANIKEDLKLLNTSLEESVEKVIEHSGESWCVYIYMSTKINS